MTQKILYWVEDDGESRLSEAEWTEIEALQRRTNLLQYLNRGQVGFLRFTYEPRWPSLYADSALPESLSLDDMEHHVEMLQERGWSWEDLVKARLAARVPGGMYGLECLMAGQSEVSDLAGDLKLVMRFLIKASSIAPECIIHVAIDGDVRVPDLVLQNGQIRHDPKGIADRLDEYRRRDDIDAAADLLGGIDSGDYFAARAGRPAVEG